MFSNGDYRANSFMGIPQFKKLEALCWKSFLSHIQLGTAGISFSCESCVEQMTKPHYRDSFSAAARSLLKCSIRKTFNCRSFLSCVKVLCFCGREINRQRKWESCPSSILLCHLSYIAFISTLNPKLSFSSQEIESIHHSSKWPTTT